MVVRSLVRDVLCVATLPEHVAAIAAAAAAAAAATPLRTESAYRSARWVGHTRKEEQRIISRVVQFALHGVHLATFLSMTGLAILRSCSFVDAVCGIGL